MTYFPPASTNILMEQYFPLKIHLLFSFQMHQAILKESIFKSALPHPTPFLLLLKKNASLSRNVPSFL